MIVIAIDPSSTCTGYAVLEARPLGISGVCWAPPALREYGTLGLEESRGRMRVSKGDALHRIALMVADVRALIEERRASGGRAEIVWLVELPLAKQHTLQAGKRSGLAVWALAAGCVYGTLRAGVIWLSPDRPWQVVTVDNRLWTRRLPKEARPRLAASLFPQYDPGRDRAPSYDAADAVLMGHWFFSSTRPGQKLPAAFVLPPSERTLHAHP
jgi:hypothetical protein